MSDILRIPRCKRYWNWFHFDTQLTRVKQSDHQGRGRRRQGVLRRQDEECRPARSTATRTPHSADHCKQQP